jgi:hypothetical protein
MSGAMVTLAGPWRVVPEHREMNCRVIAKHGHLVAEVWSGSAGKKGAKPPSMEVAIANAELIAAAPDLFRLLRDVLRSQDQDDQCRYEAHALIDHLRKVVHA